jgi:hypothetical protein
MRELWRPTTALWGDAVKRLPQEGRTLYKDLTDDKATWVDAVFWMVIGSVLSGGAQALIELAIRRWAGE